MLKVKVIKVFFAQKCNVSARYDVGWREFRRQMTTMKKGTLDLVNIVEMLGCPSEEVLEGSLEGHMVVAVT